MKRLSSSQLRDRTSGDSVYSAADLGDAVGQERLSMRRASNGIQLRGLLKLLFANTGRKISSYEFDALILHETQSILQKRKRRILPGLNSSTTSTTTSIQRISLSELTQRQRFICFFVIQGGDGNQCYSKHTLSLRKRLAMDYHDYLMTFVVPIGGCHTATTMTSATTSNYKDGPVTSGMTSSSSYHDDTIEEGQQHPLGGTPLLDLFCQGTGFGLFPTDDIDHNLFITILNITQVPSVIVIDSMTGRIADKDALLSIEKNDPTYVINAWHMGKSGLSSCQKIFACILCETNHYSLCTIQ